MYDNTDVMIENKCGMVIGQSVDVGNLWEPVSHKFSNSLHRE